MRKGGGQGKGGPGAGSKPMVFGSKEWNEFYGLTHGSRRKGDQAQRAGKALRHSITKRGEREYLEAHEPELRREADRRQKVKAAEDRAEARILGASGKAHAVKIAKPSGTFGPEDVAAFAELGWEVHPAGSVSAKTGLSLGAIEPWDVALNPEPDFGRILGPQQAARALVLAHPETVITAETLQQLRESGYDVAAAPKALREGRLKKSNPTEAEFTASGTFWACASVQAGRIVADLAWIHSKHPNEFKTDEDVAKHIRFVLEGESFLTLPGKAKGSTLFLRQGSGKCSVVQLIPLRDSSGKPGYRVLTAYTLRPAQIARALEASGGPDANLGSRGRGHEAALPGSQGLPSGKASRRKGKDSPSGTKRNPEGQHAPGADTRPAGAPESGGMKKSNPTKSGRGAASKPTARAARKDKAAPRPEPSKVQPLKSAKADRYRAEKTVEAILEKATAKPKASKKPAKPKATLESATLKIRFNPGSSSDVARVWKAWTGAKPGQVLRLKVEDPTGALPEEVALLGRVSRFIGADGSLKDFGASGPLLVTDGKARQTWLVHPKGFDFDLSPSIICYLARKPKFGDRGPVEYVHRFDRPARARMEGQVGALTGGFQITPRGIEG